MSFVKLGSVKSTDLVLINSVDLAADCGTSILPVANGGTGNGSYTNGQLLIGNTTGNTLAKATLTGTADQVVVTNGGGSITLSLPQSIATTSSPTFATVTTTSGSVIDGIYVGRRTTEESTNVFVGTDNSVITTGAFNTGIGEQAVHDVTSGVINTGCGYDSLGSVTTGDHNTACGGLALGSVVTGSNNAALGERAGSLLTGSMNTLGGAESMLPLVTGDSNTAFGYGAGEKQADGSTNLTTAYRSVYLGAACCGFDDTDDNTIVIGYAAKGEGPNTTAIGNVDTTSCHLFGTTKVGDGTDETKTATFDCSGISTGTNRAFAFPNASGTFVLGGGTCSGACSGTNTGDQTSVTGNAGTATALQTSRTIGGSSFDGTANVTSFPEPGAIGGTTPSTGRFTKIGIGVAPSGAASALLCVGGNPATFTSANYIGVVDSSAGGALVLAKDGSNYATLQYSNATGSFVFQTVEATVAYANSMAIKSGCFLLGGTTVPSGATRNLVYEGGPTSPVLGAATADCVPTAGIDVAAGDRQLYARTEGNQANRLTGLSCRVSTDFSKTSDVTLANVTGLTRNVMAGEVYAIRAVLFTTSNVAGGVQCAIGGTATATSIIAEADVKDGSALATAGTTRVAALATAMGDVTAVTAARITIEGQIVVNAAGTITIQFAQNASNGTASTVKAGSYMQLISIGS